MFRDRWLRKAQRRDDVAHGAFREREVHQDVAASRLGYGVEDIGRCRGTGHDHIIFPFGNM